MKTTLAAATIAISCLSGAASSMAHAQSGAFPNHSVRAVLPYSVGSGPDAVSRIIGEQLTAAWKQPFIVENKPGANGWLAIGEIKRSAPDGYSMLVVDNTPMTLQPHLYSKLPFDPMADFTPVAPIYRTNFFIVVSSRSPWNSVSDLIAAARQRKGEVTYGSWGIGSVAHIGTAEFERKTGTSMTHVPFKELPQLYTAVANGEVDWAFGTAATVQNLYQAKRVKLLALAAPSRLGLYPEVPTVAESGGPAEFEVKTWVAAFAPKGTPDQVVQRLNGAIATALAAPSVQKSLQTFGFEPWVAAPGDVAKAQAQDTASFATIVKQSKISLD
ncbi:TctC [Bordetella sputigena]|uniref:Bug family tripartite tricarboxylate transporter substrate binding protein n=1 Tax=Bordetella sputigena TaxID=1416810 RepID=UPI0039EF20A6